MKTSVSVASMVTVLLLATCGTPHRQPRTVETRVLALVPGQAEAVLTKYKEQGWILVGIMTGSPISPSDQLRGYRIKRQLK